MTDKSAGQSSYSSQQEQKEQEQFDELHQSADIMNMTEHSKGASFETTSCVDKEIYILPFEFPINRIDLQNYLDSLNFDTDEKVWFNGKINTRTGKAIALLGG